MEHDALHKGVTSFGRSFVLSDSVDVFLQPFSHLGLDDLFPRLPGEWLSINDEWKKKSTNEIIAGCVGALDDFSNAQISLLKKYQTRYHTTPDIMSHLDSTVRLWFLVIYNSCILELCLPVLQTTIYLIHLVLSLKM